MVATGNMECIIIMQHNKRIQLTVKSVTFFAKQKNAPLFTSADAGVIRTLPLSLQGPDNASLPGNLNDALCIRDVSTKTS